MRYLTITNKNSLFNCGVQLLLAPFGHMAVNSCPKDEEVRNIRLLACESLSCNSSKHPMWASVLQKYCSVACLCPQEHGKPLVMQQGLGRSNYATILPLNHPIMLRVVGCCKLFPNALLGTHIPESIGDIFPAIVTPQCFDLLPIWFSTRP